MKPIPILGPSSGNPIIQVNPQKTINLWPKIEPPGARTPISLYRTPGYTLLTSSLTVSGFGRSNGVSWKNKDYFVVGSNLIAVDENDIVTTITPVMDTNNGYCHIAAGRDYLMVVDGVSAYTYNGTTFAKVSDVDLPANPSHVVYVDGYFLVNKGDTDDIYRSDLENPASWQALGFGVASASPDIIKGIAVYDRDIIVCGSDSTQIFYNNKKSGFNYGPYPKSIPLGLVAPQSIVSTKSGVTGLMAGKEGGVGVYTVGNGVIAESSDDDNEEIRQLSLRSDAIGSVYARGKKTFYVLTFPTASVTKVFELGAGLSHHMKSKDIERWRISGICYSEESDRMLAVDYANDNIYVLDPDSFTENGETIRRERYTQIIHGGGMPFDCSSYRVEVMPGVGLISGTTNPLIQMRISRDGGKTYTGFRNLPVGKIGQYEKQTIWKNLGGDYYMLNTHIVYDNPTDFALIGGFADISY